MLDAARIEDALTRLRALRRDLAKAARYYDDELREIQNTIADALINVGQED